MFSTSDFAQCNPSVESSNADKKANDGEVIDSYVEGASGKPAKGQVVKLLNAKGEKAHEVCVVAAGLLSSLQQPPAPQISVHTLLLHSVLCHERTITYVWLAHRTWWAA